MLSGATAPVIVSQGNLVQGEGPDSECFKDLYGLVSSGESKLFQTRETKNPLLDQGLGEDLAANWLLVEGRVHVVLKSGS